jgi:hypothetical protein
LSAHDIISYSEIEAISENNENSHTVNDKGVAHGVTNNVKEEGDSLDLFMMGVETSAALETKLASIVKTNCGKMMIRLHGNGYG